MISAQPGWYVIVWSSEHGGPTKLPIVSWRYPVGEANMEPFVLTEDCLSVERYDFENDSKLFVAIMSPDMEIADFIESAEEVAKAHEEWEARKDQEPDPGRIGVEVEG